jgi:DNA (cytosine-5)-methyltransferase 1
VAERSRKTDRAVAPVPFRVPYSRIGNLMAELPDSFIYELRSTPAAPKPYLTGLRRPSAERATTQICGSPAGPKRANDPRNRLWRHYLEYVRAWKPQVFLFENVPGLLREFPGFSRTVEAELNGEYRVECRRLVAQFYGTPQFRDRVILQGVRRELSTGALWPKPTCSEFYVYTRKFDVGISMAEALQDLGPCEPFRKGCPSDHVYVPLTKAEAALARHVPNGGSLKDIPDRHLPVPYRGRERTHSGWTWFYRKPRPDLPGRGVISSIRPNYATILAPDISYVESKKGWEWNAVDPLGHTDKRGFYTSPVPARRLTVRECARLQTFPDWFEFVGSPVEQHRQIGNAVPVELSRRLCESAALLILDRGSASAIADSQLELF